MTQDEIYTRLHEVFRSLFDDETIQLSAATTAADIEEWDSLTHIDLIVSVEKTFGIRFTTREVAGLKNVGEFVRLIEGKVA